MKKDNEIIGNIPGGNFLRTPFTTLQPGSRKSFDKRQRCIDPRQNFLSPRNLFSSRSFTCWICRINFEIHAKKDGYYNKVAPEEKSS